MKRGCTIQHVMNTKAAAMTIVDYIVKQSTDRSLNKGILAVQRETLKEQREFISQTLDRVANIQKEKNTDDVERAQEM